MGRRKIEIQPITHERNRSVTFLKRKNGLFKKAYELGVLCSVDVAVIIFEERPGHHVKLYQYGSSDIHDIVQRHLRHDGEKDTRGPQDFSGNNANKLEDIGDGDDDDDADDDDQPSRMKRRHDGKLKTSPDMGASSVDYTSPGHRNLSIPQPPPLSLNIGPGSGPPSHPISNDRGGLLRGTDRRGSRIGPNPHSRSPSDDIHGGGGNYSSYYSGQGSSQFSRPNQYGHHSSQHPHTQGQTPHQTGQPYQPFFPVSSSSHTSPPPSFIPLQSDFSRGSRSGGGGSGGAPGFGLPSRSGSSSSYDNPNMYPSMMRGQPSGSSQSSGPGGGPGGDLFAAFLDADEQSRHQSHPQQSQSLVGLDWPVHNAGGGSSQSATSVPSSSSVSNPSATPSSSNAEGPNNGNWLDFLSGNNPNSSNPSAARESTSWERGGGSSGGGDMFSSVPRGRSSSTAGGMSGPGMLAGLGSGRRSRADDDIGSIHSPGVLSGSPGLNGRLGDSKRDILKDGG